MRQTGTKQLQTSDQSDYFGNFLHVLIDKREKGHPVGVR